MAVVFTFSLCHLCTATSAAGDWAQWRGPYQSGYAPENGVVTDWSPDGKNVAWHKDFGGRTTPVIFNGRVFFNGPVGEGVGRQERVICLDADTGDVIWENRFNVFHTDVVENRVGWTALAVDTGTGNVYCHGTGGDLFCWDRDGKQIWKRALTEELGRISGYGGRLINPIIDEDRVVISFLSSSWGPMAKGAHRYYAFDKNTGDVVWVSTMPGTPLDTTYAMPAAGVINGKRMLVCPSADGWCHGLLARTGEIVWSYKLSKRGLNTSAIIDGNRAYVSHSEENYTTTEMGAIVCLDASKTGDITETGELWRIKGLTAGYSSPALAMDRLYYITNDANLFAIDAKDGRIYWEYNIGRVGKGSPTVTGDGVIYVGEQTGVFHILKDEGDKCVSLSRHEFTRDDGLVDELYGSPAVVNGRVYFMTRYNTYCLASPDAPRMELSTPMLKTADAPASVELLVPADATVQPGGSIRYRVVGSSSSAQVIPWQYTSTGVNGIIGGPAGVEHTFYASTDAVYSAGVVSLAKGAEAVASARVRIIPDLPISLDFNDMKPGSIPPGWVGTGGGPKRKIEAFDLDGERVLRKIARKEDPSPPFMRLRTYTTMPIEGGYVTQCDMMSRKLTKNQWVSYKPEMGLINSRYRFIMLGAEDILRIESWSPVPRLRQDVPFVYEPDVWYTVKFEVKLEASHAATEPRSHEGSPAIALCRAKVWKRGEAEPDGWTIEIADPFPNTEGSAGLYAYSTGTTTGSDGPETFFDNFKVYRDE
jgi:outer membrane protein assembly factor BamB